MANATIPSLAPKAAGLFAKIKRAFATGPEVFHRNNPTILVPVRNDAFTPALNCGEFAVVDTSDRYPEHGALFYLQNRDTGSQFIVQLLDYKKRKNKSIKLVPDEKWPAPFWEKIMGYNTIYDAATMRPKDRVIWSDDYLSECYLLPQIVGRVIGVLGHEGRSVTWGAPYNAIVLAVHIRRQDVSGSILQPILNWRG